MIAYLPISITKDLRFLAEFYMVVLITNLSILMI